MLKRAGFSLEEIKDMTLPQINLYLAEIHIQDTEDFKNAARAASFAHPNMDVKKSLERLAQ